jgi:hypothetical protein
MADKSAGMLSKSPPSEAAGRMMTRPQIFTLRSGQVQACLVCGQRLPASYGKGRPRKTCSPACLRRRDFTTRKVRRRQHWIDGWRRLAAAGQVARAQMRREVNLLQQDIDVLLEQARPRQPDDEPAA